jgi:hypothetical protein
LLVLGAGQGCGRVGDSKGGSQALCCISAVTAGRCQGFKASLGYKARPEGEKKNKEEGKLRKQDCRADARAPSRRESKEQTPPHLFSNKPRPTSSPTNPPHLFSNKPRPTSSPTNPAPPPTNPAPPLLQQTPPHLFSNMGGGGGGGKVLLRATSHQTTENSG